MPNILKQLFQKKSTEKPSFDEVSKSITSVATQWKLENYNPDDLVQKKGLVIYDKMRKDDTCKAALSIKKLARLSTDWDIVPASEEEEDKKKAEFVKWCLTDGLSGTFQDILKQIYTALDYGYSISEKIWQYIEVGQWAGKYGFKAIKTRSPHDFNFVCDEFGNLEQLKQTVNIGQPILLDPAKFIIYIYQKEFDNWYGISDLRAAYKHWISKDWIMKFQNIALERFGMGVMVGKYPRYAIGEKSSIQDILDTIQAKTSIVVPNDIALELMEMKGAGINAFDMAIKSHNTAIMRSVLVPDLLGFSEFTTGSYALGKKHFDVFLWILNELGRDTSETIVGEQIIKQLIDYNFPNTTKYPVFQFAPLTEEDKFEIAKIWTQATQFGTVISAEEDENYFRSLLGFPKKKESTVMRRYKKRAGRTGKEFTKKVNYDRIEKTWDNLETKTVAKLSEIVGWMRDKLLATVEKRQIVENKDPKEVERLQLAYVGDFKDMIFKGMATAYISSKNEALEELRKAGFKHEYKVIDEPLPPEEALAYFEGLPIKLQKELAFFKQKAFTITGIESTNILEKAKLIIYEGIKNEAASTTMQKLKELFYKYLPTMDAETGKLLEEYRLYTIVRTNVGDAINQGRKAMFEDPDVKDDIVAMMSSAVLDDSTTEFCMSIDNVLYAVDTFVYPLYHYNCRCIAVAVTRWETGEIENLETFPASEVPGL